MKQPQDHRESRDKQRERIRKATSAATEAMRLFAGSMAFTTFRSEQYEQSSTWLSGMDDEQLLRLSDDLDKFQDRLHTFLNDRNSSKQEQSSDD